MSNIIASLSENFRPFATIRALWLDSWLLSPNDLACGYFLSRLFLYQWWGITISGTSNLATHHFMSLAGHSFCALLLSTRCFSMHCSCTLLLLHPSIACTLLDYLFIKMSDSPLSYAISQCQWCPFSNSLLCAHCISLQKKSLHRFSMMLLKKWWLLLSVSTIIYNCMTRELQMSQLTSLQRKKHNPFIMNIHMQKSVPWAIGFPLSLSRQTFCIFGLNEIWLILLWTILPRKIHFGLKLYVELGK